MAHANLETYLQDHDAGSMTGLRLARLCAKQNQGTAIGAWAQRLIKHIEQDRVFLAEVLHRLGAGKRPVKEGLGQLLGVMSHLKLRRPGSRSPLGRFELMEGLLLGVSGRHALWRAMELVASSDPRLRDLPFTALAERAAADVAEAETHRLTLARQAFLRELPLSRRLPERRMSPQLS